jgi:hypothetical protein
MKPFLRSAILILAALASAAAVSAGTVSGIVHNGTTNKPQAGAEVILLQLQGGMEAVATTKADAQGHFQFDRPELGAQPMLLRVPYRGVNYHEPVPPGATTANVEIFGNTQDAGTIQITHQEIVFQPNGQSLLVGEEFIVENQTRPPVAFFRADGTFTFSIPVGAQLNQVSAWGASGMPLVQGTIDKGENKSAIAFPFRPGQNGVRMSFEMPYPSNETTVHTTAPYRAQRILLVVPPTVQVLSAGFQPAGSEQGWNIYSRENVAANTPLDISVTGTAPPPSSGSGDSAAAGDAQNPSVNSRADEGAESGGTLLPGRLEDVRWILTGGIAALFALGLALLIRKPAAKEPAATAKAAKKTKKDSSPVLADVDRQVSSSLDEIKENLFRLELRRQAGTISEDEYARQRGRAEKILRDLVRG